MNNSKSDLKKAIADHAQQTTGQVMSDGELEASANALVSFFELLAQTDQKRSKQKSIGESNERL